MKREINIIATPAELAEAFCDMNDEQQAQFFIDVAEIGRSFRGLGAGYQWWLVGKHLKTCACSTEDARDLILEIAKGIAE